MRLPADGIDHDVNAAATGEGGDLVLQTVADVRAGEIDDMVRTGRSRPRGACRTAHRRHHRRGPEALGELDRRHSHRSRGAQDQYGLAWREPRAVLNAK